MKISVPIETNDKAAKAGQAEATDAADVTEAMEAAESTTQADPEAEQSEYGEQADESDTDGTTSEALPPADDFDSDEQSEASETSDSSKADESSTLAVPAPENPVVRRAEQAYINTGLEVQRIEEEIDRLKGLKDELKEAREAWEMSREKLLRLRSRLDYEASEYHGSSDRGDSGDLFHTKTPAPDEFVAPPETGETSAELSSDWQSTPISELWASKPIERFGKKKQESLVEKCPTLGAFEELRTEASRAHKALHEVLPRGIGQDVADELENRQLDWLSKVQVVEADTVESVEVDTEEPDGTEATPTDQPEAADSEQDNGETDSTSENGEGDFTETDESDEDNDSPYSFGSIE